MIRFLFRLLGFFILAGGFVALVIDGTRAAASGVIDFTTLSTSWAAVSPETLANLRETLGAAAQGPFDWLIAQPTAAVLIVIGVLFMLIGRRKRRPIGVKP